MAGGVRAAGRRVFRTKVVCLELLLAEALGLLGELLEALRAAGLLGELALVVGLLPGEAGGGGLVLVELRVAVAAAPLREAPQHCIVQVLRKLGTLDQLSMGVKCCPVLNILLWVSILHLYLRF